MLGKCMGKLDHPSEEEDVGPNFTPYTPEQVLARYALAVECAPERASAELLLEPHHKLVSTACKYVLNDAIEVCFPPLQYSSIQVHANKLASSRLVRSSFSPRHNTAAKTTSSPCTRPPS